jgi:hypothetical protein
MDIARVRHGLLRDLCLSSAPSLTECPLLRRSAGQMNRRRIKTKSHISELSRSSRTAVIAPNQHIPEPLNAECSAILTKNNVTTVVRPLGSVQYSHLVAYRGEECQKTE